MFMLTSQTDVLFKLQFLLGTVEYIFLYGALTNQPNHMNIPTEYKK